MDAKQRKGEHKAFNNKPERKYTITLLNFDSSSPTTTKNKASEVKDKEDKPRERERDLVENIEREL